MMRFTVLPRAVVALNAIRSQEAIRPILNGVHLAPDGTMTATDGHVLLTWRNAAEFDDTEGPASGLLGVGYVLEITPAVLRLAKLRKCAALSLEIAGDVATWTPSSSSGHRDEMAAVRSRIIEGPYPNYRQVIPRYVPEIVGAMPPLNAEYVGRFALAAQQDNNNCTFTPTGNAGPVLVTFAHNPDALGLLMPMRDGAAHEIPAWVHPVTTAAPEVAPAPDCPAAEHDDTNAECTCAHSMRIAAVA